jgi:hypothetical protein
MMKSWMSNVVEVEKCVVEEGGSKKTRMMTIGA